MKQNFKLMILGMAGWLGISASLVFAQTPNAQPSTAQAVGSPNQVPTWRPGEPVAMVPAWDIGAQWWQWVQSIPAAVNPLSDVTGQACMVGQMDAVWFLVGYLSPDNNPASPPPFTRYCSIPEGTMLAFPAFNVIDFNTPNLCGQDSNNLTVNAMRTQIAPMVDTVTGLKVTVDQHQLPASDLHRYKSPAFATALPEKSVWDAACPGIPAGIYSPSVDDGYYVQLRPLPKGKHTIRIQSTSGTFVQDITYVITVVPVLTK